MCANTLWPPSISTRNIALGSASKIVPSTSIFSSLLIKILTDFRQNPRTVFCYRNGVLYMRGQRSVARDHRPTIRQHFHVVVAQRHHRLDGKNQSWFQPDAGSRFPVIRDRRLFVHLTSDSVSNKIT